MIRLTHLGSHPWLCALLSLNFISPTRNLNLGISHLRCVLRDLKLAVCMTRLIKSWTWGLLAAGCVHKPPPCFIKGLMCVFLLSSTSLFHFATSSFPLNTFFLLCVCDLLVRCLRVHRTRWERNTATKTLNSAAILEIEKEAHKFRDPWWHRKTAKSKNILKQNYQIMLWVFSSIHILPDLEK